VLKGGWIVFSYVWGIVTILRLDKSCEMSIDHVQVLSSGVAEQEASRVMPSPCVHGGALYNLYLGF
jgi:hypothetical protein